MSRFGIQTWSYLSNVALSTVAGTSDFIDMWTIFKQAVHDKAQILDMASRFNSIVAYLDTNVIYFGQLMSGAEQDEFCFVTVQFKKVLSHPDVDSIDAFLNPGNTVEFGVRYTGLE